MAVNKTWIIVAALAVLVCAASVAYGVHHVPVPQAAPVATTATTPIDGQPMLPTKQITVGKTVVLAEVADSQAEQVSGLSGRVSLKEGTGMLFVFPQAADLGFWMKDMLFPIDMVFADASSTIVTIVANAAPDSYPQTFHPTKPAMYVLEVPAGFAAANGIVVGQKIALQ